MNDLVKRLEHHVQLAPLVYAACLRDRIAGLRQDPRVAQDNLIKFLYAGLNS